MAGRHQAARIMTGAIVPVDAAIRYVQGTQGKTSVKMSIASSYTVFIGALCGTREARHDGSSPTVAASTFGVECPGLLRSPRKEPRAVVVLISVPVRDAPHSSGVCSFSRDASSYVA